MRGGSIDSGGRRREIRRGRGKGEGEREGEEEGEGGEEGKVRERKHGKGVSVSLGTYQGSYMNVEKSNDEAKVFASRSERV